MDAVENSVEQSAQENNSDTLRNKPRKKKPKKKRIPLFLKIATDNRTIVNYSDDEDSTDTRRDTELPAETESGSCEAVKVVENVGEWGDNSEGFEGVYFDNKGTVADAFLSKSPDITEENKKPFSEISEEEITENESPFPDLNVYNKKSLSKTAKTYELEKFEKNYLLIFNQKNVDGYKKPRLGTEEDVKALRNTFGKFGFEVEECFDLTKKQIFDKLNTFSTMDFTDYGCVAIAILSHGSKFGTLYAKDEPYGEIEIIDYLKVSDNPFLVTKPRILIVQACRGSKTTQAAQVNQAGKIRKDHDESNEPYTLPVESDMVVLHSSYVGKLSFRNEVEGSWFIQTLCKKIDEMAAKEDLMSIMTEVKREVAAQQEYIIHNKRTLETDIVKQMPVTTTTLIRKLYFKKYGDEMPAIEHHSLLPTTSGKVVQDSYDISTPRLEQCYCFLHYFEYMRSCLRFMVQQYPTDYALRGFLIVADTFGEEEQFHKSKEALLSSICTHFRQYGNQYSNQDFLYLRPV